MRFSKKLLSEANAFESLRQYLSYRFLHALARKHGFIRRRRRFRAVDLVRVCLFWDGSQPFPTLSQIAGWLRKDFGVKMSEQSLAARFHARAASMLKEILYEVLSLKFNPIVKLKGLEGIGRILVLDSTFIELSAKCSEKYKGFGGSACSSGLKLQYCFELLGAGIECLSEGSATASDLTFMPSGLAGGDLLLIDTGYVSLGNLRAVMGKGAFFLAPLRHSIKPLDTMAEPVDLHKLARKMKVGQLVSMPVLLGVKDRIPMRMVVKKVPEEVAAGRRRKMKADPSTRHKNVSKERLALCDLEIFITNLSPEQVPAESLWKVYSLRWQIEICFKTWKSHFKLDKVPKVNVHRFECFFWGCLVRILISFYFMKLFKAHAWNCRQVELSELKTMKLLAECTAEYRLCLLEKKVSLKKLIQNLTELIGENCRKQGKKGRKTPFQKIEDLALN